MKLDDPTDKVLLFVYGTLRKNHISQYHSLFAKDWQWFSLGYFYGNLYEVDGYPGATLSEHLQNHVLGEIYAIPNTEETFISLDIYEGCDENAPQPYEYHRCKVPVHLENKSFVMAWTYLYNGDTSDLSLIPSGDYLA